jgi:NTE family protein
MVKMKINYLILAVLFISSCAQKKIQVKNAHTNTTYETAPLVETKTNPAEHPAPIPQIVETNPAVTSQNPDQNQVSVITPAQLNNKTLPKFGFIFSGGGAKAWAHIGFLKELQKFKWPIHSVAGFEWGSVVAASFAQNLSANEVEWEMSKLKDFDKTDSFLKAVFEKKNTTDLKVPFVCPSLNLNKQTYYLLNRGQLQQLIPFCVSQPPITPAYGQSVAVMSDITILAQHLRSTGANRIILVNVLAQTKLRSFVNDYTSAENILWVQSAALMAKKPSGVDELININLDDYGIKDLDKRRDLIAKGAELSYDQLKKLAQKYGL